MPQPEVVVASPDATAHGHVAPAHDLASQSWQGLTRQFISQFIFGIDLTIQFPSAPWEQKREEVEGARGSHA
jgi:hypothetical protein